MEKLKNEKIKEVELQPSWSKLKSFHEKAVVGTKENGDKYLKSFGFLVCEIINGEVKIHTEIDKWDSKTTIRHLNNFLYENNLKTGNLKEITEMYITKTKKDDNKTVDKKETAKKSKIKKFEKCKNENKEILVEAGA